MDKDLKRRVGARIRALRAARGLTQEQLAERVDRSIEAISHLERGRAMASVETLQRLAIVLAVPIQEFFDEEARGTAGAATMASGATAAHRPSLRRVELETRLRELLRGLSEDDAALALDQIAVIASHRALSRPPRDR